MAEIKSIKCVHAEYVQAENGQSYEHFTVAGLTGKEPGDEIKFPVTMPGYDSVTARIVAERGDTEEHVYDLVMTTPTDQAFVDAQLMEVEENRAWSPEELGIVPEQSERTYKVTGVQVVDGREIVKVNGAKINMETAEFQLDGYTYVMTDPGKAWGVDATGALIGEAVFERKEPVTEEFPVHALPDFEISDAEIRVPAQMADGPLPTIPEGAHRLLSTEVRDGKEYLTIDGSLMPKFTTLDVDGYTYVKSDSIKRVINFDDNGDRLDYEKAEYERKEAVTEEAPAIDGKYRLVQDTHFHDMAMERCFHSEAQRIVVRQLAEEMAKAKAEFSREAFETAIADRWEQIESNTPMNQLPKTERESISRIPPEYLDRISDEIPKQGEYKKECQILKAEVDRLREGEKDRRVAAEKVKMLQGKGKLLEIETAGLEKEANEFGDKAKETAAILRMAKTEHRQQIAHEMFPTVCAVIRAAQDINHRMTDSINRHFSLARERDSARRELHKIDGRNIEEKAKELDRKFAALTREYRNYMQEQTKRKKEVEGLPDVILKVMSKEQAQAALQSLNEFIKSDRAALLEALREAREACAAVEQEISKNREDVEMVRGLETQEGNFDSHGIAAGFNGGLSGKSVNAEIDNALKHLDERENKLRKKYDFSEFEDIEEEEQGRSPAD